MMRYILVLGLSVIALMLTGCKLETLSNGDFDGYWHVMRVDTLSSNRTNTEVFEERIFWAVEGNLLQLRYLGRTDKSGYENYHGYYMRFSLTDTRLVLYEPRILRSYQESGETGSGAILSDTTELQRFGIYEVPEQFGIEKLTSRKMILKTENLKLYFAKQ